MMACNKCNSTGYIEYYAHVQGGICFRCQGTGHHPGDGVENAELAVYEWVRDVNGERLIIDQLSLAPGMVRSFVAHRCNGPFIWIFAHYHGRTIAFQLGGNNMMRTEVTEEQYKLALEFIYGFND